MTPGGQLRWTIIGATVLVMIAILFPVRALLAAAPSDSEPTPGAETTPGSSSFGSATPTEKFVQSFQQQVTQQLQAALTESRATQEARLHGFEQQQRELGERLQSLQQSLSTGGANAPLSDFLRGAPMRGADIPVPHVNVRRPATLDPSDHLDGIAQVSSASGILSALAPDAVPYGGNIPGAELGRGQSGMLDDASPSSKSFARLADANISPNGFVEGRLLNGVVSIVGGPDRESIVALQGNYQAANGFLSNLDGCFALVQARPEIASGRIDFKLSRLTCNFPDGASRTWDAAGWLVDQDGIRGVRATIVENLGRKAIAAGTGGAVAGAGQRLSQQQYQVSATTIGGAIGAGTSATFVGSPGRDALGGAATGAANTMTQSISDYYNLFGPSLQIGGGTPVTVVLANDLRLPSSGRELSDTHMAAP